MVTLGAACVEVLGFVGWLFFISFIYVLEIWRNAGVLQSEGKVDLL